MGEREALRPQDRRGVLDCHAGQPGPLQHGQRARRQDRWRERAVHHGGARHVPPALGARHRHRRAQREDRGVRHPSRLGDHGDEGHRAAQERGGDQGVQQLGGEVAREDHQADRRRGRQRDRVRPAGGRARAPLPRQVQDPLPQGALQVRAPPRVPHDGRQHSRPPRAADRRRPGALPARAHQGDRLDQLHHLRPRDRRLSRRHDHHPRLHAQHHGRRRARRRRRRQRRQVDDARPPLRRRSRRVRAAACRRDHGVWRGAAGARAVRDQQVRRRARGGAAHARAERGDGRDGGDRRDVRGAQGGEGGRGHRRGRVRDCRPWGDGPAANQEGGHQDGDGRGGDRPACRPDHHVQACWRAQIGTAGWWRRRLVGQCARGPWSEPHGQTRLPRLLYRRTPTMHRIVLRVRT
mmetsp:Transcript_6849/g.16793  ORF Transcript_6849/g.16793 Transcript_6849/m.16793 type:complete len:408 (+) Transcript_6849:556-1779(+)